MSNNLPISSTNRYRVLLVDDEPQVTNAIVRALDDEPYAFLAVHSGAAALQVLAETTIDVIVVDECMPGMSGTDLLTQVKQRHPDTIRIMLTGQTTVQTAMKAIHDGWVYQYLQKPCNPADLAASLHNALVLRSFMLPDEGPHMRMAAEDHERLLEKFAQPTPATPR
jgi:two-component system, probable response regulator PhcQ